MDHTDKNGVELSVGDYVLATARGINEFYPNKNTVYKIIQFNVSGDQIYVETVSYPKDMVIRNNKASIKINENDAVIYLLKEDIRYEIF